MRHSGTLFQCNQSVTHYCRLCLAVCKHCSNVLIPGSGVLFPIGSLCTTSLQALFIYFFSLTKGGCLIVWKRGMKDNCEDDCNTLRNRGRSNWILKEGSLSPNDVFTQLPLQDLQRITASEILFWWYCKGRKVGQAIKGRLLRYAISFSFVT